MRLRGLIVRRDRELGKVFVKMKANIEMLAGKT